MASENPVVSDRFEIRRQLGAGGMGVVYEAFDTRVGMTVALKTLKSTSANLLYHFKNEFRSLADLHHPNLISLYELFAEDGKWFFTMELVSGVGLVEYVRAGPTNAPDAPTIASEPPPGGTLLAWGDQSGAPPGPATGEVSPPAQHAYNGYYDEDRVRRTVGQLAAGLSALHAAGVVHRDIKPSNILVSDEGRVVLMDFGLAADAVLMEEWAATRVVAGTPAYMAPEQGSPGAVGTAADWYSVGAILYEIFTGRLPHGGTTLEALVEAKKTPPPPLAELELPVEPPADLARLCERLLAPDPAARPRGAEVLEQLGLAAIDTAGDSVEVFVGRGPELARLRAAYASAAVKAASVFVEGASGLGKTALVDAYLEEPRAANALVLRGRCYAEESVPYKAFDGIIDALSRHLVTTAPAELAGLIPPGASQAARLFPVLLRVPLIEAPPPAAGTNAVELRSLAFAAIADLLAALGRRRRLVLFIDDLQWADPDSLLLLSDLLHPATAPPVLLIASVRTGAGIDAAGLAERTRLAPEIIAVEPLDAGDSQRLLARLAPDESPERLAEIEREARGHPLFIAELARSRMASGARLDDALWARAQALDADARRVLEVVAVAGVPIDLVTAVEATGFAPARCAQLASRLKVERLVKYTPSAGGQVVLEPYHDRVRESVVSRLSDDARLATSRDLAGAMLSAGMGETAPEAVVRHLLAIGDVARSVELAERAAERALAALAFDRAAGFFRTALEAGPEPAHARRLHLRLAEALASAGRGGESAAAFLEAGAASEPDDRLDCRRRAAEQLLGSGNVEDGLAELRAVLESLGEPLPATARDALASLEATRARLAPLIEQGVRASPAAGINLDLMRRLDTFQASSIGLVLVDNVRGAEFQARALELALRAGDPRRLVRALILEGIYRAQESAAGRVSTRELFAAARSIADGRGDFWMDSYLVFAEAWLLYYEGRFKRCVELFTRAEEMFRQLPGVAWEHNTILIHRLRATDYQGAWSKLRPLYDQYLRDAQRRDDKYIEASIRRWFNVLWLAHDRPDLAGQDLDNSPWAPPAPDRYHLQHFLGLRARVELAFYRGDGARQGLWARPGLDAADRSMLFRIQIAKAIADWLRGRISACEGDPDGIDRMVAALDAQQINYASIWSGLLAGSARHLRGDRAGAVASLGATAELAEANDFPLCAAIARLRAAQLSGDGSAVHAATTWMRGQDIHNPLAMAEVFAPGYPLS